MKPICQWGAVAAIILSHFACNADIVDFIKEHEGFRRTPYKCQTGRKTIGYGSTSSALVNKGLVSELEAAKEVRRVCSIIEGKLLADFGKTRFNDNERMALVSFIYNVGWTQFRKSTMWRKLKEGKRGADIKAEFLKWVYVRKAGRKIISRGLFARRMKESAMFCKTS